MSGPVVLDSGNLAQVIASKLPVGNLQMVTGQVTNIDSSGDVTVDLGGNDRQISRLLTIPVQVGDNVRCLRQGSDLLVLGPVVTVNRPVTGTVASAPSNSYTILVTTSIGTLPCGFIAAYTPTTGDIVEIAWWGTTPLVVGKQGKTGSPPAPPAPTPPPTPAPPAPSPRKTYGTTTFPATGCGTHRSSDGWRNDANGNVIQGTAPGFGGLNQGAWFHGNHIHSTLHGAAVRNAWIYLGRTSGGNYGGQTIHLQRVTDAYRPSGALSFGSETGSASLDIGQHGWFNLPNAFAQALIDSGGSVGIQAPSGPYIRCWGLAQSGSAGAVKISWVKG